MLKPEQLHYEDVRNKFSLVVVVVTVVVVIVVVVTVVVDSGGRDVIKIVLAVVMVAALPTPAPEKYEYPGNLLDYAAFESIRKYVIPCWKTIRIRWEHLEYREYEHRSRNLKNDNVHLL